MNDANLESLYNSVQQTKVEINDAKRMMYNNNKTALQAIESKKSETVTHGALVFDISGNDFRFRNKTSNKSININAVDRTIKNINKIEFDNSEITGISDELGDDSTIAISQKCAKELVSNHNHDDKYALVEHTHTEFEDLTVNKLNDKSIGSNGSDFFIPYVAGPYGVMEVGRYIDFHTGANQDYNVRILANNGIFEINKSGTRADVRCGKVNGYDLSTAFALADHNHDDRYAKIDHTHETGDHNE